MKATGGVVRPGAAVRWLAAVAGLLVLVSGCRDTTGPQRGAIEATVSTLGEDIDPDGYSVVVGDSLSRHVEVNASTVFSEVPTGNHQVNVTGVAENCTLTGGNPRTVTVFAGDTVSVSMEVTCTRRVGDLEVSTTTTGDDPDPDGYLVTVDGETDQNVSSDGTVTFEGLAEGDHEIALSDVASNCTVEGSNPRTVTVPFDQVSATSFELNCVARVGSLEVNATTSGSDVDTDGYTVTVDGGSSTSISPNGSVTFEGLAEGDHQVRLSGLKDNCSVGSNPRTVTVVFGETASTTFRVSCSPPGALIAFDSDRAGNKEIYLVRSDGGGLSRVTNSTSRDVRPDWSRDGSRIAFVSDRDGQTEIYTVEPDGTGLERVTENNAEDKQPFWSPDGSAIVFVTDRDGNDEIYIMNADGTGLERITNNSALDYQPAWSPDGSRIAFASDRSGNLEIYTMAPDGSGLKHLTDNSVHDGHPAWSPDGSRIAFASERDGNREIYTMNPDGSGLTRVTNNPARDITPSWSGDGSRIAFTSDRDGNNDIYTVKPDGTEVRAVTGFNSDDDAEPSWGPNR